MADTGLDDCDTLIAMLESRGAEAWLPGVMVKKVEPAEETDQEVTAKPDTIAIQKLSKERSEQLTPVPRVGRGCS